MLNTDDGRWLVVGNELGHLQVFDLPVNPVEDTGSEWAEVTDQWNGWKEGEFAAPALEDLDGDGAQDLALGIRDGGVTLWHAGAEDAFRGCSPIVDRLDEIRPDRLLDWNPAPNPVSAGGWFSAPADALWLIDLTGRHIARLDGFQGRFRIPHSVARGTYLLQATSNNTTGAPVLGSARRIVVEAGR